MPILDIFKKKKKTEKKDKVKELKAQEPEKQVRVPPKEKKLPPVYQALKSPHITEKATQLASQNQYVFRILEKSNKAQVKKQVESLYGVDVLDVRIIKARKKRRRVGRILGFGKGYKKAIVKIKKGQKIELLPR